jgi:hypothetical protein
MIGALNPDYTYLPGTERLSANALLTAAIGIQLVILAVKFRLEVFICESTL